MHIFIIIIIIIDVSAPDILQFTFPCLLKEEASSLEITFEMKSVLKGAGNVTLRVRPISKVLEFAYQLGFER
jgi:hypothetical protein